MGIHRSVVLCITLLLLVIPAELQEGIQSRRYRPRQDDNNKCDRSGRCTNKDGGHIEETDQEDFKVEKERPAVLTRDDYPTAVGVGRPGIGSDYKPKPGRDDEYDPKPVDEEYVPKPFVRDRDVYEPKPVRDRDVYEPKPIRDRDVYEPKPVRNRDVYEPKPIRDRDVYEPKPEVPRPIRGGYGGGGRYLPKEDRYDRTPRPVRGGGYIPKPAEEEYRHGENDKDVDDKDDYPLTPIRGGGYNPKPVDDEDDYLPKPVGSGGYNPKPVHDKDDYPSRPVGGGGYNPKPINDKDDYPPRPVGGGGYNPKPINDKDDYPPRPVGGGGYNPKPINDKDDYPPRPVGGGGYNPKPVHDKDDYPSKPGGGGHDDGNTKPDRKDLGGYDDEKKDNEGGGGRPLNDKCICVPYYQCEDGHIVTDGAGIIDARKRPETEDDLPLDGKSSPASCGPFHVCCSAPESSTVKPFEHRCGRRNPTGINSRILSPSNKGEADFGEWPWQAAVLKAEGKINIFMCGGVLIDKLHVLTVAHCVFHLYQSNEYPLKVRLGEWDTQTTSEFLAHEDYDVSKILVHPEFRNTSLWNDVAILRLDEPVLFAPHIDTVCLPKHDELFSDHNCVVTGWGKDAYKGGTFSNVMKEVAIQVIDNYKCEEMLRKTRLGRFFQLHEGFLCAGGEYGLDSCKGDGGGPLVCYRKDKTYALAGIVSWGIDCGQREVPGVYIKIQKYIEWISKTTGVQVQDYWPLKQH